MSQQRGSWSNEDTRPIRPVRLDDTQSIRVRPAGFGLDQEAQASKRNPIYRLFRLFWVFGFVVLILFIVYLMANGTKSVPFVNDVVTSFSTGPSDAEVLQIIQAKQGRYWSDIKILAKNQCPLSEKTKANGIEEAWTVFFSYKQQDYESNTRFVFLKTSINPNWSTDDWIVACP